MQFLSFPPCDQLKPFVKHYWLYKKENLLLRETILPSGYFDLAIKLRDTKADTILNSNRVAVPDLEILGQITSPALLETDGPFEMLIIRFYPNTASYFLPNPVSEFTNQSVDASDVFLDTEEFCESVRKETRVQSQLRIVEQFLLSLLQRSRKNEHTLQLTGLIRDHLEHTSALLPLKVLSDKTGFSKRYLQKVFFENVGLTMKQYRRIFRFNQSLNMFGANASLTELSYNCGYFDQSHFVRDFKAFSGTTPGKYLKANFAA